LLKKQEELKNLKDAIYSKVMAKKQDLEKVTQELIEKEETLKVREMEINERRVEMDAIK
jgi:chaperonin cofactor prefoldin